MRVGRDGEDEEDEETLAQARPRSYPRLHPPAATLSTTSTSHAASCCDQHEPGLAYHLLTTYHNHISTSTCPLLTVMYGPHYPACTVSSRSSPRLASALAVFDHQSSATTRRGPAAAAAAEAPTLPTSHPTTAPLTSIHRAHQHLAPTLPMVHTRPAPGFEPREVAQPRPPPAPPGRV